MIGVGSGRIEMNSPSGGKLNSVDHSWYRRMACQFAAWMFVGTLYGIVAAPEKSAACVIAFVVAGWIVCSPLSIVTFLTTRHFSLIIICSILALLLAFVGNWHISVLDEPTRNATFLFAGALFGGTSRVWSLPVVVLTSFIGLVRRQRSLEPVAANR